jgi:transcriptional regulator with XRE-family HTH domain
MTFQMGETGEQTIQRVLSTYEIGARLRALRLRKKIALVDLGKHTGLSASMLSQLETGKMVPTLPTLARIAMVFDVGLDYFFDDRNRRKLFNVVRRAERIQFPDRPDAELPSWYFECLAFSAKEKDVQAYLAEFPPREPETIRTHAHEGTEFVYVTRGTLVITCHAEEHILETGDSAYFDSTEPHSYRGTAPEGTQAVIVTTGNR